MTDVHASNRPIIRAASVLIEDGRILLVKQDVTATRHWSLPGGKLEIKETLEQCITRELKEETGLDARIRELLYITDRIIKNETLVHISFLVDRFDSKPLPKTWNHLDQHYSGSSELLREVRMVPIKELRMHGFSERWQQLVKDNFLGRGSYQGDYHKFYGES